MPPPEAPPVYMSFKVVNTEMRVADEGDGYMVRHQIEGRADAGVVSEPNWTSWAFMSNSRAEHMAAWMQRFMVVHGHLKTEQAGAPVH